MSALLDAAAEASLRAQPAVDLSTVTTGTVGDDQMKIQFQLPTRGSAADLPIDRLPAKPEVLGRLRKAGIMSIGQLAGFSVEDLLEKPGLGACTIKVAEKAMCELGYRLKMKIS
jgi:DNA-directed RNA polymerase alpha subunit